MLVRLPVQQFNRVSVLTHELLHEIEVAWVLLVFHHGPHGVYQVHGWYAHDHKGAGEVFVLRHVYARHSDVGGDELLAQQLQRRACGVSVFVMQNEVLAVWTPRRVEDHERWFTTLLQLLQVFRVHLWNLEQRSHGAHQRRLCQLKLTFLVFVGEQGIIQCRLLLGHGHVGQLWNGSICGSLSNEQVEHHWRLPCRQLARGHRPRRQCELSRDLEGHGGGHKRGNHTQARNGLH
mmetsp:Transcript_45786/g.121439  ORF Transcript_45786/g.121439 Transcript_45786/m.121439 type:complete len:234 (+) Transcript_45786:167-868(+)